jgi:hypothetical protein
MAPERATVEDRAMTGTNTLTRTSTSPTPTANSPAADSGGGSGGNLAATWQGLAHIPQMLGDVKTGILTLRALISTPAAAMATGSPAAGAAIVALGAELVMFLAQTIEAIDKDIDAMTKTQENYQRQENELATSATAGTTALSGLTGATRPGVDRNGGFQSCVARGAMQGYSYLDDVAEPIAAGVRYAGESARTVLGAGERLVTGAGSALGSAADNLTYVPGLGFVPNFAGGRSATGDAIRAGSNASAGVLRGASDAVQDVENSAAATAAQARIVSRRADDLLTLEGSCTTPTTPTRSTSR